MDTPSRVLCLRLESLDELDDPQGVLPSIEDVAGLHEMGRAPHPVSALVDESGQPKGLHEVVVGPVHVAHRHHARGFLVADVFGRGRRWRAGQ